MIATLLLATALASTPPQLSHFSGGTIESLPGHDPSEAADGWIAYGTDAITGKADLCCWEGWQNGTPIGRGCRLGKASGQWHTGDSDPNTIVKDPRRPGRLLVLGRMEQGVLQEVLAVGQSCPVDLAGQSLTWLGSWDNPRSADWLESAIRPASRRLSTELLRALAYHADGGVETHLSRHARSEHPKLATDAIFWLGETRGSAGLAELETLLEELPQGRVRRQINFALAQNQSEAAAARLASIARADASERQRADALFWMAKGYPEAATPLLTETVTQSHSNKILEAALHGLSELNSDQAVQSLREVALSHQNHDTRGKAMFWLAQSHPAEALSLLTTLLQDELPRALIEPAIFALSQVPPPASTNALLELAADHSRSRAIRRQALFWLAQSDDPKATEALVSMLQEHGDG